MLEKTLEELTAVVKEHAQALHENTHAIQSLIGSATAAKAAADSPPAEPAKPVTKKKTVTKKKATAAAAKKPTAADVKAHASTYINLEKTRAGHARLTQTFAPICSALGIERLTAASEDQIPTVMECIDQLMAAYAEGGVEGAEAAQVIEEPEEDETASLL